MFKCIRDNTPCLPRWWVDFTLNYSLRLVVVAFLVTAGILAYTVTHFKINTDLNDMVSDKLPFRKIEIDYGDAFPQLSDTIVVFACSKAHGTEPYEGEEHLQNNLYPRRRKLF